MAASLSGVFNLQQFTDLGALGVGMRLYTYIQGTTTHKIAYTDQAGTISHTYTSDGSGGSYIALNARGELPAPLYLTAGSYDLALKTSTGATVWTRRADPMVADLAASTGASLVGFIQAGTGAVASTMQTKARETVSAKDFGALNDSLQASAATNRLAIQAAVDYCNTRGGGEVTIGGGGVYYVDTVDYVLDGGGISGITTIKMKDNVAIYIERGTTIRLKDSAYGPGAFYRMFSSRDATRLSNGAIYGGGVIDGNKANQTASAQCSNILLEALDNVSVTGISSINANGQGIQVRGTAAVFATKINISNNIVTSASNIGIQSSQFDGLLISGNTVDTTTDNCIDIYGEDGSTTAHGKNYRIVDNKCKSGLVGIFLETVAGGVTADNTIESCTIGATINRINGEPRGNIIHDNRMLGCATGIRVTGDTGGGAITDGGNVIHHNFIANFTVAGVQLGGGGNCSYVDVRDNYLVPVNNTTPVIKTAGATISFCKVFDNTVYSSGITEAYLYNPTATTHTGVVVGGFRVLPIQVGPLLNDYSEGTFTPKIAGSTTAGVQTYTVQTGTYTKIGRVVHFKIYLAMSAKDGATAGDIRIADLPFTSSNVAQSYAAVAVGAAQSITLTGGYTQVVAAVIPNSTSITVAQIGSNQLSADIPVAGLAANSSLMVAGSYNT